MKRIAATDDYNEATLIKIRLESIGIPVFIAGESSAPLLTLVDANRYTVWVEIDEQLECATKALADEEYLPQKPIDIQEYRELQASHKMEAKKKFAKVNDYILNVVFIAGIAGAIWYFLIK